MEVSGARPLRARRGPEDHPDRRSRRGQDPSYRPHRHPPSCRSTRAPSCGNGSSSRRNCTSCLECHHTRRLLRVPSLDNPCRVHRSLRHHPRRDRRSLRGLRSLRDRRLRGPCGHPHRHHRSRFRRYQLQARRRCQLRSHPRLLAPATLRPNLHHRNRRRQCPRRSYPSCLRSSRLCRPIRSRSNLFCRRCPLQACSECCLRRSHPSPHRRSRRTHHRCFRHPHTPPTTRRSTMLGTLVFSRGISPALRGQCPSS